MKKLHNILPIMVVAMLLLLSPVIKAEAAEGKPGQTVSVSFSFNEIRGLDGVFTFSNEAILENISYSSSFSGVRFNGNKVFYSTTHEGATAGSITVTATIKKDAAVGSTCTITLGDINITDANTNAVYSGSKSEVVSVVKEPVATKAPVTPTATPASQSGGQNGVNSQNQVQNNSGSQSIEVTKKPQNNNNSSSNNNKTDNNIEATREATISPSEVVPSEVISSDKSDDSIETNANVKFEDSNNDKESTGKSSWLILLILSIIVNLILLGILIWRKIIKTADTGKDTPLVDYDINEDDEPLEIEENE